MAVGRAKDATEWLPLQKLKWQPATSKTPMSTEESVAMPLMNSFNHSCIRMKVFMRVKISKTERHRTEKGCVENRTEDSNLHFVIDFYG